MSRIGIGTISVGIPKADLQHVQDTLAAIPNGARIAIYTAINDTLRSERVDLGKHMQDVMNLPAMEIRNRIKVKRQATKNDLSGELAVDYQAVQLRKFKGWKYRKRAGVTVQMTTDKGAQAFAFMFAGMVPNAAKRFIFQRIRGAAKYAPRQGRYAGRILTRGPRKGQLMLRQPLKETFGPSVLSALESRPQLVESVKVETLDKFQKRLESKMDWLLQNPQAASARKLSHI